MANVFDAAIEPLDYAVHRWRKAILDAEVGRKLLELMLIGGLTLAQAKQLLG